MKKGINNNILSFLLNFPLYAGLYCIITGVIVLTGWLVDIPIFRSLLPEMPAMKFNTAISFILLGFALALNNSEQKNTKSNFITILFSVLVLFIAAITSLEYLFDINLGIDELLIKDIPDALATSNSGRMSPITSIIFILLSCSFILSFYKKYSRVVLSFTLVAFALSYMVCLGYVYGQKTFYGVILYTQIALNTSMAFFILSIGLLFLQTKLEIYTEISKKSIQANILKRFIPAVILIPALMGAISLYAQYYGIFSDYFGIAFIVSSSTIILLIIVWMNSRTIDKIDTVRRIAEEDYLHTSRLLNNVIEGNSDPIAALDLNYNFLVYNEAYKNDFKKIYDQDIKPGQCVLDILDLNSLERDKFLRIWGRALKGESFNLIEEFGTKQSVRNYYELRYSPILNNNKLIGASVIGRNITEKKLAEDKISHLNRLYAVLYQINQLIVRCRDVDTLFDESCRILIEYGKFRMAWIGVNDYESGFVRVTSRAGYDNGYLEKISIPLNPELPTAKGPSGIAAIKGQLFVCNDIQNDPIMLPWHESALERGYNSSAAFPIVFSERIFGILAIYGSEKYFFKEDEVDLLKELTGDIAHALQFIELEKQKHEAQEKLKELNEDLEKRISERTEELSLINKELESFAYSVSHDLRSPLRHITSFVQILKNHASEKLDSKSNEYLNYVSDEAIKMAKLIDDLLVFSKIGRTELIKYTFDSRKLVDEIISDQSKHLEHRKINWIVGELPVVTADKTMLKLVFINLIDNAVKFTSHTETAEISIQAYQENNYFVFYIRDNGAGFDMELMDKLFGVFQRLHTEEEFEGTGIGLANVHRIITRHGGKTWAEGCVNKGATFYFTLPIP